MPKDLNVFLDLVRSAEPGGFARVTRRTRPRHFELTAVLEHLARERRFPLVLFEDCENLLDEPSGIPVVSNVFASRELCALALDFPPEQALMPLSLHYARLEQQRLFQPLEVPNEQAPVCDQVYLGEDVDLRRLPIVRHFEMDLAPVLTMCCCMRDPDLGTYDVSFVKTFYKGPRYMGVSIHTPHLERTLRRYEELGKPAPIVNILGHHPAFSLGALALTPYDRDDYESIGEFLQEPLRLTPSQTWGADFMVPADAEIIIEGEVPPGVRVIVDPFGEVTRHYQAQCLRQAFNVTALTRRANPIMQDIFSGHEEAWNLGAIPKEGGILNSLRAKLGTAVAVHMPHSGVGRLACYVSIKKVKEGDAKRMGMLALNEATQVNVVVVVDDIIDVFNEQDVLWAVMTAVDPSRDVDLIRNVGTVFTTGFGNSKVIIDATRPLDKPYPAVICVPEDVMREVKIEEWIEPCEAY